MRPRLPRSRLGWLAALLLPLALVFVLAAQLAEPEANLVQAGPNDGAHVDAEAVETLEFRVDADRESAFEDFELRLNGLDVTRDAVVEGNSLVYAPTGLRDGEHELALTVSHRFPQSDVEQHWDFVIDTVAPELTVDDRDGPLIGNEPAVITGSVDDPDARVEADGSSVTVGEDGKFTVEYDTAPSEPIALTATDRAGNATSTELRLAVVPSRVKAEGVRTVHMTAYGFMSSTLRQPVMDMIEDGLINAIQLDLKDESGVIGYDSEIPLANEIGSAEGIYNLRETVAELHEMGIPVIGRIVAFRDPILATHAWDNGNRDYVLQTPSGDRYAGYGGFTNFAHPDVRQYNIDIAVEAAAAGVDDILWDYIRRPDGPIENLVVTGLDERGETPSEAVVSFLAEADEALRPYGVGHGASLYGIAVTRPTEIAQDVPAMSEHLDYIAPMVYPSHWNSGEYGVADPNNQPYDIVYHSIKDFVDATAGTRTRIVPWLQDFSLGASYGPDEVRAQIEAANDAGADEWLLWNAGNRYTRAALE